MNGTICLSPQKGSFQNQAKGFCLTTNGRKTLVFRQVTYKVLTYNHLDIVFGALGKKTQFQTSKPAPAKKDRIRRDRRRARPRARCNSICNCSSLSFEAIYTFSPFR